MKLIKITKKDAEARLEKIFKMYTNAGLQLGGVLRYYNELGQPLPKEEKVFVNKLIIQLGNVLDHLKKAAR